MSDFEATNPDTIFGHPIAIHVLRLAILDNQSLEANAVLAVVLAHDAAGRPESEYHRNLALVRAECERREGRDGWLWKQAEIAGMAEAARMRRVEGGVVDRRRA